MTKKKKHEPGNRFLLTIRNKKGKLVEKMESNTTDSLVLYSNKLEDQSRYQGGRRSIFDRKTGKFYIRSLPI